jgi:Na+-driven multidrug efflux pump
MLTVLWYLTTVAGNIVNIVLDPILMFSFNFGVGGAAVATVISQ